MMLCLYYVVVICCILFTSKTTLLVTASVSNPPTSIGGRGEAPGGRGAADGIGMKIMMGQTVQDVLYGFQERDKLSTEQCEQILHYLWIGYGEDAEFMLGVKTAKRQQQNNMSDDISAELASYLELQTMNGAMDDETAYYITNMLRLNAGNNNSNNDIIEIVSTTTTTAQSSLESGTSSSSSRSSSSSGSTIKTTTTTKKTTKTTESRVPIRQKRNYMTYEESNIVQRLGNWQAPETVTSGEVIHNGIWGYKDEVTGREYALACTSYGLHIVDVTEPLYDGLIPVQFIEMSGGLIWRDVVTHRDDNTGITYAYVAGQYDAELWVINLSALSHLPSTTSEEKAAQLNNHRTSTTETTTKQRHDMNSNPIPPSDYKILYGYYDYGHTIHCANGFLFINTARDEGIIILDVQRYPWNPYQVAYWTAGDGHDCTYMYNRGHLFSSDGWTSKWSIVDMNGVRERYEQTNAPVNLNQQEIASSEIPDTYAHSSTLTPDGQYMYAFDENNFINIGIYDISDPYNMIYKGSFSWIDQDRYNAVVHNGHVRGNLLHVAYYAAGYRVYDISDPINPVEVGWYDTMRLGRRRTGNLYDGFIGAWNCYVDLPSGNVIVSDTVRGLYVFTIKDREDSGN